VRFAHVPLFAVIRWAPQHLEGRIEESQAMTGAKARLGLREQLSSVFDCHRIVSDIHRRT
jgi:hypothetical protein